MKIVVFLRAVSSEILSEISPFALFFVKKQLKKHDVPLQKNRYVLWKMSFFCGRFFLKFCVKSHLLPFFLSKNNKSKNTMYSAKKPLRFSENCRFFAGGFSWYSYWNITLSPCFGQKTSKKTPHPLGVFASFWPWILLLKLILLITDENRFLGLGIFLGNSLRLAKIKTATGGSRETFVRCKKTVTICEILRFFPVYFSWNSVWNLTFCPFFWSKHN